MGAPFMGGHARVIARVAPTEDMRRDEGIAPYAQDGESMRPYGAGVGGTPCPAARV